MMNKTNRLTRNVIISAGVAFIVLSCAVLGLSLWEAFGGLSGKIKIIDIPGFHELELDTPGLYAGVYQHRGTEPMPTRALSALSVHVMTKDKYEEVPVLMNNLGLTFDRMGIQGMPLFNFSIEEPGAYTLSAAYEGDVEGPRVQVYLVSQTAGNIKQTLVVGVVFFLAFLGLGIYLLLKLNQWAPAPAGAPKAPEAKPRGKPSIS